MVSRHHLFIALLFLLVKPALPASVEMVYERGDKQTDLQLELQLPETDFYARGQGIILYQIETRQRALHLRYANLNIDNVISYRIPLSSEKITDNLYRHSFGWTLHPIKSGTYKIRIPDVAYYRGGNINYRIKTRPVSIDVQAVPDYIPRHIPVGAMAMMVRAPSRWLMVGSQVYVDVLITTHGMADSIYRPPMPTLFNQYATQQRIQLQSVDKNISSDGLHTTYHYLVPINASQSGLLKVREKLQWFDPRQQIIQSRIYQAPISIILSTWQLVLGIGLLSVMAIYLFKYARQYFIAYFRRINGYRKLQSQLGAITTIVQLRAALSVIADAEGLPKNRTISQLMNDILSCCKFETSPPVVASIQAALYGQGDMSVAINYLRTLAVRRIGWFRVFLRNSR